MWRFLRKHYREYVENMDDYVDWRFVGSIFSIREYTLNLTTRRKQLFFCFYVWLTMILTLVLIRRKTAIGAWLIDYVEYTLLSLAVILYSVEPCVLILQALILAHPGAEDEDDKDETNHSKANRNKANAQSTADIAIVISCHRSSDVIVKTVKSCLKHVHPHQIFVMDNANFLDPPDNTREVLDESDLHEVNYIYNPFGNKTLAMFAGSVAAKDFKYCLLIDDDVTIPDNMKFGKHLFSTTVRAVCYPIRAVHPQGRQTSLFVEWQGIEYKMSDYSKLLQHEFSTVLYPHGAICLWERSTLIQCFRAHDTIFYADDVKMGLWFQRQGYEMRMYHKSIVDTEAPTTIVGPYPNYYNQRVRSWDMAEHAYAYEFFRVLFFTRHKTFMGTLVLKWFQFYSCYSVLADWIRIPVMFLTIWVSWRFFVIISGGFVGLYTILTVVWDWLGYRRCPERRSRLVALLTFQLYKIPSIFIRLLGMGRAFFVYLPNFKAKPTIPQLEEEYAPIVNQPVEAAVPVEASGPTLINNAKFPVWLDKTNPFYAHYDPKNPTYTGKYESEPDVPDEMPAALPRDPDSDSVTTLTMDEALWRDQDSVSLRPTPARAKRRTSPTLTVESLQEENEQDIEQAAAVEDPYDIGISKVHDDEEIPSNEEDDDKNKLETFQRVISDRSLSVQSTSVQSKSSGSNDSSTFCDAVYPTPLSVVPEEGVSQSRAGQETSDSSGALTSAIGGHKTVDGRSDSSGALTSALGYTTISTHTCQHQYPRTTPSSEAAGVSAAVMLKPRQPMVDTVPGGSSRDSGQ